MLSYKQRAASLWNWEPTTDRETAWRQWQAVSCCVVCQTQATHAVASSHNETNGSRHVQSHIQSLVANMHVNNVHRVVRRQWKTADETVTSRSRVYLMWWRWEHQVTHRPVDYKYFLLTRTSTTTCTRLSTTQTLSFTSRQVEYSAVGWVQPHIHQSLQVTLDYTQTSHVAAWETVWGKPTKHVTNVWTRGYEQATSTQPHLTHSYNVSSMSDWQPSNAQMTMSGTIQLTCRLPHSISWCCHLQDLTKWLHSLCHQFCKFNNNVFTMLQTTITELHTWQ